MDAVRSREEMDAVQSRNEIGQQTMEDRTKQTKAGVPQNTDNKQRKALFFDIDGTLLGDDLRAPKSAVDALHEARKRGHLVLINSGRTYALARCVLHYVEADGLLCGCGTEIHLGDRCIYQYLLPDTTVDELRKDAAACHVDLVLEGPEGAAFSPDPCRKTRELLGFVREQHGEILYPYEARYAVNKFCLQEKEGSDIGTMLRKYEASFYLIDRGGFYECVPKGHNKGEAILRVLQYVGIPLSEAYAFGDSMNDYDMLKTVPHAVIMGDHAKGLEAVADFTTKRLEEDGIAYAMKTLGII